MAHSISPIRRNSHVYALKDLPLEPFNELFSARYESIILFSVVSDSMSPFVKIGDTVCVYKTKNINENKVSLVEVNGKYSLRRIQQHGIGYKLVSDNPAYPEIYTNRDSFNLIGVVNYIISRAI